MRIVVTGASGHFGRTTASMLLEKVQPADIILITRNPDSLAEYKAKGVNVRAGSFDEPDTLAAAFAGGDRLLLISTLMVGHRVAQHGNAIAAAKKAGVRHVVYTSFIGSDPSSPAVINHDHFETELLIKASGLVYTILRDSQYTEAMAKVAAPRAVASGKWISSAADGKIAMISRNDCVASAVAVLTGGGHENKTYNLTGPELVSFRDCAQLASELSGRPIEYIIVDDDGMYAQFDSWGVPRKATSGEIINGIPWCSEDMVSFGTAIRTGHFAIITDDVEKLTGRKPKSVREVFMAHRDLLTGGH